MGDAVQGVAGNIVLVPATDEDWPTIRRWLAQPEVIRWWGPRATTEAEVMLALGSEHAISRMIVCDGVAVGYGHAVDAALLGVSLPAELPVGAWEMDVFVASAEHRGRGIGVTALAAMQRDVFATTLAPVVYVRVPVGQEKAVRAYERAGLRWLAVMRDPVMGPEWMMAAVRSGSGDIPAA
jgi:RimJ/RimL family protein N-acetyltransferase